MTTVATYAAATPETSTPRPHACGVSVGSWPMVWANTQPAPTDMTNWKARMNDQYSKGAA